MWDSFSGTFQEDYTNLTRKQMFALDWIRTNCKDVRYILKADDDGIVNLPLLQHILEITPLRRSMIGE